MQKPAAIPMYTFGINAGFDMPASVLQGSKYTLLSIIVAAWPKSTGQRIILKMAVGDARSELRAADTGHPERPEDAFNCRI
jgi:hypothetical protein